MTKRRADDEGGEMDDVEFKLPSPKELEAEIELGLLDKAVDMPSIHHRIREVAHVLADFRNRREEGRKRSEYISLLMADCCRYYGYNQVRKPSFNQLSSFTQQTENVGQIIKRSCHLGHRL